MNPALLNLMSGPIMALVRYAVAAGSAYVANKQWVDGNTITAAGAAIIGLASAGIGALTSTKAAKLITTAGISGAAVQLPNGKEAGDSSTVAAIIASDPTWSDPNAR